MQHGTVHHAADGLSMTGELLVYDGSGPRATVMVVPVAVGLTKHAIGPAKRLAEEGETLR